MQQLYKCCFSCLIIIGILSCAVIVFRTSKISTFIISIAETSCDGCSTRERRFQSKNSTKVALASFSGAGNTWARHLIEQITGIYSGSVYHDARLRPRFPGESIKDGSVSVIKTHKCNELYKYNKAIIIHRGIKDCMVSTYNLMILKNHTGALDVEKFKGEKWKEFIVTGRARASQHTSLNPQLYKDFYTEWLVNFQGEILVLRYRDLVSNLYPQLEKIRDFLGANATDNQLHCIICLKEGSFHRQKNNTFDPWSFIPEDIAKLPIEIDEYVEKLVQMREKQVKKW